MSSGFAKITTTEFKLLTEKYKIDGNKISFDDFYVYCVKNSLNEIYHCLITTITKSSAEAGAEFRKIIDGLNGE